MKTALDYWKRLGALGRSRAALVIYLLAAFSGLLGLMLDNPWPQAAVVVLAFGWALGNFFFNKKLRRAVPLLLAVQFASPGLARAQAVPDPDEPYVLPLAQVCLVAVLAGAALYAGCRLNDFCKRKLGPAPTNSPPANLSAEGGGSWAVAGPANHASCFCPPDFTALFPGDTGPVEEDRPFLEVTVTTFDQYDAEIQSAITHTAFIAPVSREEFINQMHGMGLVFAAHTVSGSQNGQPVPPDRLSQLPAVWHDRVLMLTNGPFAGRNYAKVTLESSPSLGGWYEPLFTYVAPIGLEMPISLPHPGGVQAFYRTKAERFPPSP